jgi:Arm DNA-binding domain
MSTNQNIKARQKITKRLVDGLAAGQTIWDAEITGFGVRRQRRDASFVLKYLFRRRQRFYTIGRHGIITVEEARTDARRLLGLAASGIDPAIAREEQSVQPPALTVGELCASYLKEDRPTNRTRGTRAGTLTGRTLTDISRPSSVRSMSSPSTKRMWCISLPMSLEVRPTAT